jgi:hypothetical protein
LARELLGELPALLPRLKILRVRQVTRRDGHEPTRMAVEVLSPRRVRRTLLVETQGALTPSRVRVAAARLKAEAKAGRRPAAYPMLAATFLSPRVRAICREEGIGYLDRAGNACLAFDDCYLERIVDDNPFPARGRPASLFSPVSSRIARALLEEPARRWQVSELARVTRVSLGQASSVTRRLVDEEYLTRAGHRLRLANPGGFLDAWREDPRASLTHSTAGYYSFEQDPRRLMQRVARAAAQRRWTYAVTSFAAASLIAPFVRGVGAIEWYLGGDADVRAWVKALDLRPADAGANVRLRVPRDPGVFYRAHTVEGVTVVGNVQLYLDLAREPGLGKEQAAFLRQHHLTF